MGTILGLIYRLLKLKAPKKGGGEKGEGGKNQMKTEQSYPGSASYWRPYRFTNGNRN